MKIYEITFFVGNIPKFGGQLLASRCTSPLFSVEPLEGRGREKDHGQQMEVPGEFWCDLFIIHLSRLKTYVSVSMIIYISIFLAIYLPTYSIHPSIQTSIFWYMNYSGFERIESQIVSVIYDAIFVTRHACPPVKSLHFSLDHDWGVNVTSYWGTSIKLSNNNVYPKIARKQTSIRNGLGFLVSITTTSLPRLLILVVSAYLTTLLGTHAITQGQWMMLEPTLPIRTKIAQRSWWLSCYEKGTMSH